MTRSNNGCNSQRGIRFLSTRLDENLSAARAVTQVIAATANELEICHATQVQMQRFNAKPTRELCETVLGQRHTMWRPISAATVLGQRHTMWSVSLDSRFQDRSAKHAQ